MRQPVWIALPIAFVAVPIGYYCLLQSRRSNPSVVVLGFMLNIAATYWSPCEDYTVFMLIQGSVASSILLRYLEAATLPRHVQRKWTFLEMMEFWINSDNQVVQRFRAEGKSKGKVVVSVRLGKAVTHAERGFAFYLSYAINIAWTLVIYTFARTWFMKYPYRGDSWFLWPLELDSVLQQAMFAVLMYSNLQMSYLLLKVPVNLIFGLPLAECNTEFIISQHLLR
ncbi:hypothetical protein HDU81_002569 [Chytriomyces hyalinus]|nr:hypothetical protein HDU81_002569 [Chytriomyces hyalinus]